MKKINKKSLDLLDSCLATESPEVRAKIYKIIEMSDLDASDPLFLILTLTGQMRVLLETAPADLEKLLREWKQQSEQSLKELQQAIGQVKVTQQQQASAIRETLEQVTLNCVENLKRVGSATTSAISSANNETVNQAKLATVSAEELKNSVVALFESVIEDKKIVVEGMQSIMRRVEKSVGDMDSATQQINGAVNDVKYLRSEIIKLQAGTTWIKLADWFSPLLTLLIALSVGFGGGVWLMWVKYNEDPINSLGRDLVNWNTERILKCQRDENPKCTIWIEDPEINKK